MTKAYSSQREIRAVIEGACEARALLILVTQYLKFESNFVRLDGNEIHAKTTTDGEDALRILGVSELDLRFPSGRDFLGASTRLLGVGRADGVRTVRLSLPTQLRIDDSRKAPRTHMTEGAFATFSLRGKRMVRAGVSNISTSGLRLMMDEDIPVSELRVRDKLTLTIALPGDVTIINTAAVRHADHRNYGMEFEPYLAGNDMVRLSTWVFRRREEELEQVAVRSDADAKAAMAAMAAKDGGAVTAGDGILLATDDGGLKMELSALLGGDRKFFSVPAQPAAFRYALFQKPLMAILHASGPGEAEGILMKELADDVPDGIPVMLLGTGMDLDQVAALGRECGAAASMLMAPSKGPFLQRLVLGILRKSYGGGESPMAV
jgi:hypothetical protein